VPAAALSDVLAGHAHVLVALGVEHHALDQSPVFLLACRSLGEVGADRAQPLGEVVANALELSEAEDARTGEPGDRPLESVAGVGGGEHLGQLALELGDLVAQRPARGTLVDFDDRRAR
jgi:hypothetical protein